MDVRTRAFAASPVSRVAGLAAFGIAAAVLACWVAKASGETGLAPWIYRMNPMTALCLALSGLALCLPRTPLPTPAGAARLAIGLAVAAVGSVKIMQLATGHAAGVDLPLFGREVLSTGRSLMAPNTAVAFVLLGASLVVASVPARRATPGSQVLALGALAVATSALIAYAYGALDLVEFPGPSVMALQTGVGLTAATVGVLWMRPRRAVTGLLTDRTLGGTMARRLLPAIALTTVGLGAIRIEMARRGMLDEVNGIALLIACVLIVLTAAVLAQARELRRIGQRLRRRERALEHAVAELEAARDVAASAAVARADFIANVSHEIRNPLAVILSRASFLKQSASADPKLLRAARLVDAAANALNSVVSDVLDLSKLEAGQIRIRRAPADPATVAREAVNLLEDQAAAKNLTLSVLVRSELPPRLLIDPDRVRQILLNLIGNAVKFTDAGSVQVVVGYEARSRRLRLDVEDTGPGVRAEQRDLLFRRFSQLGASPDRLRGAGLGLAICKGLVEAMEGDIGVEGRKGGGSIFRVGLPAPIIRGETTAAIHGTDLGALALGTD